ncbi:MAG: metallophosphoesterase, partial [Clostridia bacterium]|nr:metallophosphoesterase [Clostridia bacterium]
MYWCNFVLKVTRLQVKSEELPSAFDGFKIAHISDLHDARFGKEQEKLLQAVKAMNPDMIAVTGDLIDSNRTDLARSMAFIHA